MHEQLMIDKSQIDFKIKQLRMQIDGNKLWNALDTDRAKLQLYLMCQYSDMLALRLATYKETLKNE